MISHVKTKSISAKQIFDSLTYRQRTIIDTVEFFRKKDRCYVSQKTLGEKLGVTRETINRDISHLKDLGLLEVQHRFNNSNFTSTSHWFRRPEVQNLLPRYFCNFTVTILSLSMLASPDHTSIESLRFYNPPFFPPLSYEGVSMGKEGGTDRKENKKEEDVSVPEATHIKKVCQALQRRGSTITNDDALKLLAYQPDVHERASDRFKKFQGKIKDPLAYYLFICREIINQDGRRADWNRVEKLREEGYVLLEETLHGQTSSYAKAPAGRPTGLGPQKGTISGPSYTDQVQQERKKMDEEAEARKTKMGPLAEEILGWQKTVVELQRRVSEGDIGAQWTLPMAIGKLQYLITQYEVDPDNRNAMAAARQPSSVTSTSDFKTPASCLSSLLPSSKYVEDRVKEVAAEIESISQINPELQNHPSQSIVKKSEPVTLKEVLWEGFKEYDSDEPKEEFNEEIYD